ncbi:hypothetical protein Tco_0442993 [Tanacetum coccineum]
MSRMGDGLFTYEVEISRLANIPCDLNEEDDSKQQMTHGSGEDMELEDMMKLNSLTKNLPTLKMKKKFLKSLGSTLMYLTSRHLYVTWAHERPWTDNGVWEEPTPVRHHCEPFNYKNGCSEWPTCSWKDDRYCNGGNFLGAYIVRSTLRY